MVEKFHDHAEKFENQKFEVKTQLVAYSADKMIVKKESLMAWQENVPSRMISGIWVSSTGTFSQTQRYKLNLYWLFFEQ